MQAGRKADWMVPVNEVNSSSQNDITHDEPIVVARERQEEGNVAGGVSGARAQHLCCACFAAVLTYSPPARSRRLGGRARASL